MSNNEFEINKVIHSPLRLKVMLHLQVQPHTFQQLKLKLKATSGNLSIQLQKLQKADLIKISKSFHENIPNTRCEITLKGKKELSIYKDTMSHLLKLF